MFVGVQTHLMALFSVYLTFFSEGEEWQAVRSLLGKHMLRPKAVEAYDATLNGVVDDLITKLRLRRRQDPRGLVLDIGSEFYRFGLEGKAYLHSLWFAPEACFYSTLFVDVLGY